MLSRMAEFLKRILTVRNSKKGVQFKRTEVALNGAVHTLVFFEEKIFLSRVPFILMMIVVRCT